VSDGGFMLTTRDKELLIKLLGPSENSHQPVLIVPGDWGVEDCLDHINSGDATIMWLGEEIGG